MMIIICAYTTVHAQINMVRNGGFEEYYDCPYGYDLIKMAKHWSSIDTAYTSATHPYLGNPACAPTYANICGTNANAQIPNNTIFYQGTHSGNGMISSVMFANDSFGGAPFNMRDYAIGHLAGPLTPGQAYCVTFYAVLSDIRGGYGIANIGALLDDGSIDTVTNCGHPHMGNLPQVYATTPITDTLHWTKIQGSFIANGTERYISIGNFFDDASTSYVRMSTQNVSFYQVDDVSVIASTALAYAGADVTIYAGQSTNIGANDGNGDGMPCIWYELGGAAAIDSGGTISVRPATTISYVVAMDLCGTVTYDTVLVTVLPCPALAAAYTQTGNLTKSFTYTGTTTMVDSVRWNFGDGGTATGMNPVHTYSVSGTYHVCATAYTVCDTDTVCHDVVVSHGVEVAPLTPKGEPSIWPNPVLSELNIDGAALSEVVVTDMVGRVVHRQQLISEHEVVSLSSLVKGVYVVQVVNESGKYVKRVVKE